MAGETDRIRYCAKNIYGKPQVGELTLQDGRVRVMEGARVTLTPYSTKGDTNVFLIPVRVGFMEYDVYLRSFRYGVFVKPLAAEGLDSEEQAKMMKPFRTRVRIPGRLKAVDAGAANLVPFEPNNRYSPVFRGSIERRTVAS